MRVQRHGSLATACAEATRFLVPHEGMPVAEYFAQQATAIPFIPSSFIFPDTGLFCLPGGVPLDFPLWCDLQARELDGYPPRRLIKDDTE